MYQRDVFFSLETKVALTKTPALLGKTQGTIEDLVRLGVAKQNQGFAEGN